MGHLCGGRLCRTQEAAQPAGQHTTLLPAAVACNFSYRRGFAQVLHSLSIPCSLFPKPKSKASVWWPAETICAQTVLKGTGHDTRLQDPQCAYVGPAALTTRHATMPAGCASSSHARSALLPRCALGVAPRALSRAHSLWPGAPSPHVHPQRPGVQHVQRPRSLLSTSSALWQSRYVQCSEGTYIG